MSVGESWAMEADLGNRDPNNLNDHLKVIKIRSKMIISNFSEFFIF